MTLLKIDLHIHTNHSDSSSPVEKILEAARKRSLDAIAITDHNTMVAYYYAVKIATDLIIIPGFEINTVDGHLLILGIKNLPFKSLRSAMEITKYARKNNGVIIIPHPNIPFIGVSEKVIRQIVPDAIETHNSNVPFFNYFTKKNTKLADKLSLPKTGGSDAHNHKSVGDAYTIVDAASKTVDSILEAVKEGKTQPVGISSPYKEPFKPSLLLILQKLGVLKK
jgi:predicted metal-dependent phosphoesterase TrpH